MEKGQINVLTYVSPYLEKTASHHINRTELTHEPTTVSSHPSILFLYRLPFRFLPDWPGKSYDLKTFEESARFLQGAC